MTVFELMNWITFIVTIASIVSAATPSVKDDKWVAKIQNIVNILAINVGYAKNK